MKHLCYGSFFKILKYCKVPNVTQKLLNGKLLMSVNSSYDITDDDNAASTMLKCGRNLSSNVTDYAITADIDTVIKYFNHSIVPMLDVNKHKLIVLALKDIISSDDTIDGNTFIYKKNSLTKTMFLAKKTFNLAEVLANIFLYTAINVKNEVGKSTIGTITNEYVASFETEKHLISFDENSFKTFPKITLTLKGKKFNDVFTEVKHTEKLTLINPNHIRIFHLNVTNNIFSFGALKKFLLQNIGNYVFSRARIEQFHVEDDIESIALTAVRSMKKNGKPDAKGTGNELGEVLLYTFLEQVLGAPKLMSKVEIQTTFKQYGSNSDGVHLLSLDYDGGIPYYQLVFGTSNILGDLQSAIDNAFTSLAIIKDSTESEMQLLDSTALNRSFDMNTTNFIKQIVIPSKGNNISADMAFGIFLGYSIGLNPADYTSIQFRSELVQKMEYDIKAHIPYISQKIASLNMKNYSFYFYVLPFNDALEDKKSIMNDLLMGGATI